MPNYTIHTGTFTTGNVNVTGITPVIDNSIIEASIERNGAVGTIAEFLSPTAMTLALNAPATMNGTGQFLINRNTSKAATGADIAAQLRAYMLELAAVKGDNLAAIVAANDYSLGLLTNANAADWRTDLSAAAASHNHDAAAIISGIIADARLQTRLTFGESITDWNNALEEGSYFSGTGTGGVLNTPDGASGTLSWHGIFIPWSTSHGNQYARNFGNTTAIQMWRRGRSSNVWGAWVRCYESEAELDLRYVQPSRIISSTTPASPTIGTSYAGSALTPAQTGTWQHRGGTLFARIS
jgi:hypothetical protein